MRKRLGEELFPEKILTTDGVYIRTHSRSARYQGITCTTDRVYIRTRKVAATDVCKHRKTSMR